jgi:SAM-dependent methyltransferase
MDSSHWDDRYAAAEYVWKADPNVFLAAEAATLPVGRAVDLACGEGRNAVWLAEQGWTATGVDFSDVGLDKGRRLAADRGVDVTWVCADATTWTPPDDGYDFVAEPGTLGSGRLGLPGDRVRPHLEIVGEARH